MNIFVDLSTLDVKHVNEYFDISENVVSLRREVMLHESFLSKLSR